MIEPVAPGERIFALDALRGLAVFGLLAANVVLFAYPTAKATTMEGWTGVDAILRMAVGALVEGKFYTIFSVLFGVGLWMQGQRVSRRGRGFAGFWVRRMAALAVLGLIHGLLAFPGEILLFYALVGVAALPLRSSSRRVLAGAAGAAFLLGLVAVGIHAETYPREPSPRAPDWQALANAAEVGTADSLPESFWNDRLSSCDPRFLRFMTDEVRIVRSGSMIERIRFHAVHFLLVNMPLRMLFTFWWVLAYFLLGVWIAKSYDLAARPPSASSLIGIGIGGFLAGMFLQGIGSMVRLPGSAGLATAVGLGLALTGTVCLAGSYSAALVGLSASKRSRILLRPLAATGRMSLTNYVGQSFVCAALFEGWGLGWFDRISFANALALVFGIYVLQVGASSLWLSRFRYGPLEWLWRTTSYGTRQPLLR